MCSRPFNRVVIVALLFFAGHMLLGQCARGQEAPQQKNRATLLSVRVATSLNFAGDGGAGASSSPLIERLFDNKISALGEVDFRLLPHLSASTVFTYERERVRDARVTCPFFPPCYDSEFSYALSLIVSEARLKYHRPLDRSDLYVGVGVGYGLAWINRALEGAPYSEDAVERERFVAGGLDGVFFAGYTYELLRSASVFIEAGYRAFKTGVFDRLNEIPAYERTGPFTTIGLELRPFGRAHSQRPD